MEIVSVMLANRSLYGFSFFVEKIKRKGAIKMNELVVKTNVTEGAIIFNYEELEKNLRSKAEAYKAIEYTDGMSVPDVLKGLKADRVDLNKTLAQLKEKDSEIRSMILEPYEKYKEKSDDLKKIIQEPQQLIDSKVKEIEAAQRNEKKVQIRSFFNETVMNNEEITDAYRDQFFELIFDKAWLNVSTSAKKYKDAITTAVESFNTGLTMIRMTAGDYVPEGEKVFKETLDLAKASAEMKRLQDEADRIREKERARVEAEKQAEIEKMKRAAAEKEAEKNRELEEKKKELERKEKELAEKAAAQKRQAETQRMSTAPVNPVARRIIPASPMDRAESDRVTISVPKDQFAMLRLFCEQSGIKYIVK